MVFLSGLLYGVRDAGQPGRRTLLLLRYHLLPPHPFIGTAPDMALVLPPNGQHTAGTLPCPTCMDCLDPFQTLDDHYWESDNHPKCRPCAFGFENETAFVAVGRPRFRFLSRELGLKHREPCSTKPPAPSRLCQRRTQTSPMVGLAMGASRTDSIGDLPGPRS